MEGQKRDRKTYFLGHVVHYAHTIQWSGRAPDMYNVKFPKDVLDGITVDDIISVVTRVLFRPANIGGLSRGSYPFPGLPALSPVPVPASSLLFPCPSPRPPFLSHLFLSLSFPCPHSIAPQNPARESGERCRLSSIWVPAEPGRQSYFGATEAKTGHMMLGWGPCKMEKYIYKFR